MDGEETRGCLNGDEITTATQTSIEGKIGLQGDLKGTLVMSRLPGEPEGQRGSGELTEMV